MPYKLMQYQKSYKQTAKQNNTFSVAYHRVKFPLCDDYLDTFRPHSVPAEQPPRPPLGHQPLLTLCVQRPDGM